MLEGLINIIKEEPRGDNNPILAWSMPNAVWEEMKIEILKSPYEVGKEQKNVYQCKSFRLCVAQ